ncbi:hypothetical protein DV515_00017769 [Chloebia gouldiae]|uniref:Uncharacterized protein n=1 Tax=Chloebia gouldiae TaxID=44316 RepID=A0A3L8Q9C5_CHLGU|nr:hypothetical protein DV515_00017769 [Chloebia gouldiae]
MYTDSGSSVGLSCGRNRERPSPQTTGPDISRFCHFAHGDSVTSPTVILSLYLISLTPVAHVKLFALGQPHLDGVRDPNVLQFLHGRIRMPCVGVPQILPARGIVES